jgi:hypothetical protein
MSWRSFAASWASGRVSALYQGILCITGYHHGHCEAQKVVGIDGSLVAALIKLSSP